MVLLQFGQLVFEHAIEVTITVCDGGNLTMCFLTVSRGHQGSVQIPEQIGCLAQGSSGLCVLSSQIMHCMSIASCLIIVVTVLLFEGNGSC